MSEKTEEKAKDGYVRVMSYDDILEEIGEFGKFQARSIAILWVTAMVPGIHVLLHALTGFEPTDSNGYYRCKIPGCDEGDWKYSDNQYLSTDNGCKFYHPVKNDSSGLCFRNEDNTIDSCLSSAEFKYKPFEFDETFVTRFNLVCDQNWKVAFLGSMYMVGLMIGSSVAGYISDTFGRRKAFLFCILVSSTGSLVGAFMPEYWSYMMLRVITAIGAVGLFNESFTLTVELLGNKEIVPCLPFITQKSFHGNTIQIPYALGSALLGLTAYFIRDYVTLQWVLSVGTFIQVPLWFFIPESPRWLISKGKQEEAKKLITKIAKTNGKKLILDNVDLLAGGDDSGQPAQPIGFTDLFRESDIRKYTIVLILCWPITTLGYFGLGLSMAQLGDNAFVSFILGALVEIPGYLLCTFLIDVWGRKPFFVSTLTFTGVSCIIAGFLETGVIRTTLALIGKLFAAGNFSVIYMYSAEIYPTVIRNTAVGTFSNVARIGGISAPIIALYLPKYQKQLPMLIMGGSSLIGGLSAFLLPETLGIKLPETIQEVKEMKNNTKALCSCVCAQKEED